MMYAPLTPGDRFDAGKGFHCILKEGGRLQCLGPSKGRHYPPMGQAEMDYLIRYFEEPNRKLEGLLRRLSRPVPNWLYLGNNPPF